MPPQRITLDVFGRLMLAEHTASGWKLFDLGPDGKRSRVKDIVIPDFISESGLDQYLDEVEALLDELARQHGLETSTSI